MDSIIELSYTNNNSIEFSSNSERNFLQGKYDRFYDNNSIAYTTIKTTKNFNYKIKATYLPSRTYDNKRLILDESYLSFKHDNLVISIGSKLRWWSPSDKTSLIYSYSSRPTRGIEVRNYHAIVPKHKIFKKFIGKYNYEIFINQLESNRDYSNAMLFGNRFSFYPVDRMNLSLFRVAQFGGEGRGVNLENFKNMLLGTDTTNSNKSIEETSGNQIAGIDFKYVALKNKRLSIYGQYVGEDGLDPIIDDRWIGAIFPSKRFGSYGLSYNLSTINKSSILTIEHINTDSGHKNVTYNHNIYTDGYRHHLKPIGASIDADSDMSFIALRQQIDSTSNINIELSKSKINQNNSKNNYISPVFIEQKALSFQYHKKLTTNLSVFILVDYLNYSNKDHNFKPFNTAFNIKYNW